MYQKVKTRTLKDVGPLFFIGPPFKRYFKVKGLFPFFKSRRSLPSTWGMERRLKIRKLTWQSMNLKPKPGWMFLIWLSLKQNFQLVQPLMITESAIHGEEETPMEVDFEFPKPEDTHALEEEKSEDVIKPTDSGLKIEVKPRYLLLFSILMIFYKKKLERKSSSRNLIGENKISDFLLFWILPYLLYYTEQQVNIVNEQHWAQSRERGIPQFPVVQKSAREIIKDALRSCN